MSFPQDFNAYLVFDISFDLKLNLQSAIHGEGSGNLNKIMIEYDVPPGLISTIVNGRAMRCTMDQSG